MLWRLLEERGVTAAVLDRSQRNSLTAIACASLGLYGALAITTTAVSVRLPHSNAALGALYLALFIGFLITSVWSGFLGDRLGIQRFMAAGCVGMSLATAAMVWCEALWIGLLAMFVAGLSGGMLGPPALALTVVVHPERPARMTSLVEAWFCAGSAVWPLVVAALLKSGWHWKTVYLVSPLPMLALGAAILATRFPAFHDPARRDAGGRLALMTKPFFLLSTAAIFLYGVTESGVATFLPRYLAERFEPGVALANLSVSLFWGAMGIGRLTWPVVFRRFTERQVLIGSMAAAVLAHGAAASAGGTAGALVLFAALGVAFAAVWPIIVAGVAAHFPRMVGTATGTLIALSATGGALGPQMLGLVGDAAGMQRAMWAAFGVTAAALVAACLIPRRKPGNIPTDPAV
jgi:fucose permease